jgi:NAD(P)H dehydrogenase (quinone)
MKVLVIYAHPNPKSFNHAILEEFTRGLEDGGHMHEIVDLYAIDFDPRVRLEELAQFSGGQVAKDALDQQQKVASADALAFIHPMWGWSIPAILKGWLERIFSYGFAYRQSEKGMEGLLKHSKALVLSTAGGPEEYYRSFGYFDAHKKIANGFFNPSGINNVEYTCFYTVSAVADEERKKYLETAYHLGKEF